MEGVADMVAGTEEAGKHNLADVDIIILRNPLNIQGCRNRYGHYGHYGHGRTTFSANPMAYYCIRAENYCRACQLEYDVDCAPENDSGMAAALIVIVHSSIFTRRKRCGFHVSVYKKLHVCAWNIHASLLLALLIQCDH